MNIQRALAVFAAAMIVCAVALGTLDPRPETLAHILQRLDAGMLDRLQDAIGRWFGVRAWTDLAVPLLRRPAWLLPASLALLAVGLALSLLTRKKPHRSQRRS